MFDAIGKKWQVNGEPVAAQGAQSEAGSYTLNPSGLTPELLRSIGWNGSPNQPLTLQGTAFQQTGAGQDTTVGVDQSLMDYLASKGYHVGNASGTANGKPVLYTQTFDGNNQPIGTQTQVADNSADSDVGALWGLMAGGFGAATALGAGAAADGFGGIDMTGGAAGGAADAGGLAGTGLPAYPGAYAGGTPYALAGDVAAAPEGAFAGGAGGLSSADAAALYGPEGYGAAGGAAAAGAGGGGGGGFLSQLGDAAGSAGDWMTAHPGLTNVGGSLVNGLIGGYTANRALNAQQNATDRANALLKPYSDTGIAALGRINGLMQNPSSITSDPGYAFGLGQGVQAVDRSAASKGGLYSGATQKALTRYGQDYAGTKLNDAYARYGNVAQLGATGTTNMSNNLTNMGNAGAGAAMYQGNVLQNGVNSALGQWNFANGGYGGQNPFNTSTYTRPGKGP